MTETTWSTPIASPNTAIPAATPGRPPRNGAAAIPAAAARNEPAISKAGRYRSPTRATSSAPAMLVTAKQASTAP